MDGRHWLEAETRSKEGEQEGGSQPENHYKH